MSNQESTGFDIIPELDIYYYVSNVTFEYMVLSASDAYRAGASPAPTMIRLRQATRTMVGAPLAGALRRRFMTRGWRKTALPLFWPVLCHCLPTTQCVCLCGTMLIGG